MAATKRDGLSRVQRAALARKLADKGLTRKEIGKKLGISPSYTQGLLTDPEGIRESARKERYRGTCVDCGGKTTYPLKSGVRRLRCIACSVRKQREERKWTPERIIACFRRWNEIHGKPPAASDWLYYNSGVGDREWPHVACVQREFGTWSNGMRAAGFDPRPIGHYDRTDPEYTAKITRWPKEQILQLMREWEAMYGRAPRARDWKDFSATRPLPGYPSETTVRKKFGTWDAAVRAAGLNPAARSMRVDTIAHLAEQLISDGALPSFSERTGVSLMDVVQSLGKEEA